MSGASTLLMSGVGATAPASPTGVTATAVCTKSASVSFSAPDNGGSPITSYRVTASPGGFFNTGSFSPITVPGLTRGASYTFTVTATNAIGTSPASSASNAITATDAPGAPTIGVLTKTGENALSVTFTAPADNGGSAITQYRVFFDDETAQTTGGNVFVSGSPATLSGAGSVVTGRAYSAKAYAMNATCESVGSAESNIVTA